ncbi:MAG TPA: carbon storage regulator [Pirellulales bacterium]|nr:carbon storage regulator [Pirellulales bacterium]
MLVLTRKVKQQIQIGENIVVTILQVRGQTVRVGIEAPHSVRVVRAEIADLPAKTDDVAAEKSSMVRPGRVGAGSPEADGGFSSPVTNSRMLAGESAGLYPFMRRRAGSTRATTSSLVATAD